MSYGHSFFLYLESDPPAGAAPACSPLREECISDLCHGGIENGAPAEAAEGNGGGWWAGEKAPGTSAVRSGACSISYTLRALLKKSGTSVMLRVSRRPKRRGLLSSSCPLHKCVGLKWRPVPALLPRPSARQAARDLYAATNPSNWLRDVGPRDSVPSLRGALTA